MYKTGPFIQNKQKNPTKSLSWERFPAVSVSQSVAANLTDRNAEIGKQCHYLQKKTDPAVVRPRAGTRDMRRSLLIQPMTSEETQVCKMRNLAFQSL